MSSGNLPGYLVDQLHVIAAQAGFKNYGFEQVIDSQTGDGFIADMLTVKVKHDNDTQSHLDQLNFVCKMIPSSQARRDLFCTEKVFEREVAMYQRVLPQLMSFQQERGLTATNGFYAFPKCHYAISDIAKNEHMVIMDDLRHIGFAVRDKLKPVEYEHVRLLMQALGRLHALSLAIRDQRPEVFAGFREYEDVFMQMLDNAPSMLAMFNAGCAQMVRMFSKRPEHLEFLQRLKETWLDEFRLSLDKGRVGRFSVMGHGDCWNNNMMFRNDGKSDAEICLLDWQLSRLGSPALDLSYYLMTSTTKPLRDQYFNEFLHIYYTELATTVRACGSDPNVLFTFDNLMDELKRFGRFGVAIAPMFLQVIVSESKDIVHMDDYAESINDGARDMAAFDGSSETRYLDRVADVINDARAYGWIE